MAALALSAARPLPRREHHDRRSSGPVPAKQGPTSVADVEVKNNSMLNVGKQEALICVSPDPGTRRTAG